MANEEFIEDHFDIDALDEFIDDLIEERVKELEMRQFAEETINVIVDMQQEIELLEKRIEELESKSKS